MRRFQCKNKFVLMVEVVVKKKKWGGGGGCYFQLGMGQNFGPYSALTA